MLSKSNVAIGERFQAVKGKPIELAKMKKLLKCSLRLAF